MNMKHGKKFLLLGFLAVSGTGFAQLEVTDRKFSTQGVTNEGLVVGTTDQMSSYYLWNPDEGDMFMIGGVSAGNGIGGVPASPMTGGKWRRS